MIRYLPYPVSEKKPDNIAGIYICSKGYATLLNTDLFNQYFVVCITIPSLKTNIRLMIFTMFIEGVDEIATLKREETFSSNIVYCFLILSLIIKEN